MDKRKNYYRVSLYRLIWDKTDDREYCKPGELVHVLWEGYCTDSDISDTVVVSGIYNNEYCVLVEIIDEDSEIVLESWCIYENKGKEWVLGLESGYPSGKLGDKFINKKCNVSVMVDGKCIIPLIDALYQGWSGSLHKRLTSDDVYYSFDGDNYIFDKGYGSLVYENRKGIIEYFSFEFKNTKEDGLKYCIKSRIGDYLVDIVGNDRLRVSGKKYAGVYSVPEFLKVVKDIKSDRGFMFQYVGTVPLSVLKKDNVVSKAVNYLEKFSIKEVRMGQDNKEKGLYYKFVVYEAIIFYIIGDVRLKRSSTGSTMYYTIDFLTNFNLGNKSDINEYGIYFNRDEALRDFDSIINTWVVNRETQGIYLPDMDLCINEESGYYLKYVDDSEDMVTLSLCTKSKERNKYFKVFIDKNRGSFRADTILDGNMHDCLKCALMFNFIKRLLAKADYKYVVSVWDKELKRQNVYKEGINCVSLKEAETVIRTKQIVINPTEVYVIDRFKDNGTIDLSLVYNKSGKLIKSFKKKE